MKFQGRVTSGVGRGAQFLALDWVAKELRRNLDLTPFPGTLNLRVGEKDRDSLYQQRKQFLQISDPASPDCPGYLKRVTLRANGRACDTAWFILPEKTIHTDVLEIISGISLRQHLALDDGSPVEIDMD